MRVNAPNYTYTRQPSVALQDRIVQALKGAEGAGLVNLDARWIANAVFSSERNVRRHLGHMRAQGAQRKIRISGWRRSLTSGWPTALYALGNKADAPRPKPFTPAQLNRRYRAANPDKVVGHTLTRRAEWIKPRRDEMTTALFGEKT